MIVELFAFEVARAQAVATAAVAVVFALRRPVRRHLGAEAAYRLWSIAPLAILASLFPSLGAGLGGGVARAAATLQAWATGSSVGGGAGLMLSIWAAGAMAFAGLMLRAEQRFRGLASQGLAGPAVLGVLQPRMVTPDDYAVRFTHEERDLIRSHERLHIERGDPGANLLMAILQALAWFNPLAHLAAACFRMDQELACDAAVMQRRPGYRRRYAEALLKAQTGPVSAPVACAWSGRARHPLETRIAMLQVSACGARRYAAGLVTVSSLAVLLAIAVVATAPGNPVGASGSRWRLQPTVLLIDIAPPLRPPPD